MLERLKYELFVGILLGAQDLLLKLLNLWLRLVVNWNLGLVDKAWYNGALGNLGKLTEYEVFSKTLGLLRHHHHLLKSA